MAEKEYIEREAVCGALNHIGGCDADDEWSKGWDKAIDTAFEMVKYIPAADVAPVKHGHWQKGDALERLADEVLIYDYTCSCCGWSCRCEEKLNFSFCPNCGADMRENT